MQLTSLQRVLLSLEHKEPDRVPLDIGGTGVTTINVKGIAKLRDYLGLESRQAQVYELVPQSGFIDDDLADVLDVDVKGADPIGVKSGHFKDVWHDDANDSQHVQDELGIIWRMPKDGHYFDLMHSPFEDIETAEEVYAYPWPDAADPARYVGMAEKAKKVIHVEKKALCLGRICAGMWETAMWMTGYEKFFCDMLVNESVVHAIMDRFTEYKMKYWELALEQAGDVPVIISEADDLATQSSLLVSLDLYKKLIWPYHKKLFDFIKKKAKNKAYIFFHNDGACASTIPLLIEAGVDILNPVQVNCVGMDTKVLKREYGRDITFWGALCDTQRILSFGTVEEVKEETKRRTEDLMKDGGWIAAPIHIIQSEVPPQNIMAMVETLRKYGVYK